MSEVKRKYDRIEKKCLELKKYNKEHGTNYTYGQYTALVRIGKINSKRDS